MGNLEEVSALRKGAPAKPADRARILSEKLPADVWAILQNAPKVCYVSELSELVSMAVNKEQNSWHEVRYETPGKGSVLEARVCRVHNGISVRYVEPYMRRRDSNSMLIGDDGPTDQPRFSERFGYPFEELRQETFRWLSTQQLAVFAFRAGKAPKGFDAVAICPANAGFFALSLAMIQGILPIETLPEDFPPALLSL